MHAIQEELTNVQSLSDNELVEIVLNSWKTVCDENESQRHLVTGSQWSQWVSYKESTTNSLQNAIKEHEDDQLTDTGRNVFLDLARSIIRAGHKTEPELVEEARKAMIENTPAPVGGGTDNKKPATLKERWKAILDIIRGR